MSKTLRKTILYTLFGLFFILGSFALLYAQGYRFDAAGFGIKKVGAIFVRTYPKDAVILLDGKIQDRGSRLINSGTLVQNLFPKKYQLSVSMDGYKTWHRTVTITTDLVGEIYAILLPEKSRQVSDFSPDIVTAIPGNSFVAKKDDTLYWDKKEVPGISLIDKSDDGSEILTKDSKGVYYLVSSNSDQSEIKSLKVTPSLKGKLTFDTETDQFVNYSPSALGLMALGSKTSQVFKVALNESIVDADTSKSSVAWSVINSKTASTTFWAYEKFSGNVTKNDESLVGETIELKYSAKNRLGILQRNGDFYILNSPSSNLTLVATDTRQFAFSPSGNKLAILTTTALRVLSDNADEIDVTLDRVGDVSRIIWYEDEGHLFLDFNGQINLLDLLSTKQEDIQGIASDNAYSYDPTLNILYFSESGKLWKMELPN